MTAIFGRNNGRLYNIQPESAMLELKNDRVTAWKTEYEKRADPEPHALRLSGEPGRPSDVCATHEACQEPTAGSFFDEPVRRMVSTRVEPAK